MCEFRYVAFPCLPGARRPLPAGCPDGVKIPGGLKTLNPIPSKKHDCFSRFPPGIIDVCVVESPAVSTRCQWRNSGWTYGRRFCHETCAYETDTAPSRAFYG